ncbi:hypothetical protein [Salinimicrobium sp. TH3]|uniref:hypothetical protein n=1 Tax=Salinimicrobium sp. TH3 TaxID=2997342 RepID=UPI00227536EA|nr:hypothetical protein [Salinimicrobium sp. TH3]MCY2686973.1 hypothetical protein [Salinimicrobium sp. TH3]
MEKFVINPENYRSEYIKNLNECFNGWGGDREYDWVFERKVGEHSADILLIRNDEDGVIAGSGVSYRKLEGKGVSVEIGIMTGSWTLPAARKKGCFTKMIHCSKDLCHNKDVPFLTAFVTETNPSSRRLETEGSYMFPSFHLFSPEVVFKDKGLSQAKLRSSGKDTYRHIYEIMQKRQSDFMNFSYTFEEFVGQYLERIKETTILQLDEDFAILENGVNEVKVLLLTYSNKESLRKNIKTVTNWCLENRSLKAFFFTTREEFHQVGRELNFIISPGYFTILSSSNGEVMDDSLFNTLNINMADKM